jgi:hypothetical protein
LRHSYVCSCLRYQQRRRIHLQSLRCITCTRFRKHWPPACSRWRRQTRIRQFGLLPDLDLARGQPLGSPQFTYVTPNVTDQIKSEYKRAVSDSLTRCTPLPFSSELGATIAGVPLILLFDERGLMRVRLGGSSAYVAPAPLPSSQIPSAQPVPPLLQPPVREAPPIWLPGVASPIQSLPHGPETSQDRRARCMFQSGLYGVPLTNFSQYMGLCSQ